MKLRVLVFASLFTLAGVVDGHANPVRSGASLQPQNAESPQQLVRDMVWNEIHAQTNDHTYWHYLEVQEDNAPGRLVDVFQTRDGQIHRVLAIDGQPLTGEQLEIEDKRIQRLLSDPRQLRENQKKREQDANQEMTMLEMLPDAFLFREEGNQAHR